MDKDSKERSAEMLRQCLPLISSHGSDFSPSSYAIWYSYVGRDTPWLVAALDATRKSGGTLTEVQTEELHARLHQQNSVESMEETRRALSGLVNSLAASAAQAQESTASFGSELDVAAEAIARGDVTAAAAGLIEQVRAYSGTLKEVNGRLRSSQAEIEHLRGELRVMRQEARRDPLTGLTNRRAFDEALAAAMGEARRPGGVLTAAMLDLDHFKKINDTHGHLFGDQVLKAVAGLMRAKALEGEAVARLGGEEFAFLLPGVPMAQALERMEALRKSIGAAQIRRASSNQTLGNVTVSCGLAELRPGDTGHSFVERADQALYRAKAGGRDRVECSNPRSEAPAAGEREAQSDAAGG